MKVKIKSVIVPERFREDLGDLTELQDSIKRLGLMEPIGVLSKGQDSYELIYGHRRLTASLLNGAEEIEAVVHESLDELSKASMELEENVMRKQLAWQERDKAIAHIHELQEALHGKPKLGRRAPGTPVSGWSQGDTAKKLKLSRTAVADAIKRAKALDIYPELADEKNPHTALRKLKALEERLIRRVIAEKEMELYGADDNIIHGDAEKYLKDIPDETYDLAILDPPFATNLESSSSYKDSDNLYTVPDKPSFVIPMVKRILAECYRTLKPNTHLYMFFAIIHYQEYVSYMEKLGFWVDPIPLIWSKDDITHQPTGLKYPNSYEAILFAQKGRRKLTYPGQKNVLNFKPTSSRKKLHPVERPLALEQLLITQSTVENEHVLIPFGGSGVDAIAALSLKRRYTIIELMEHHYNTIYSSVHEFINQTKEYMQDELEDEEAEDELPEGFVPLIEMDKLGKAELTKIYRIFDKLGFEYAIRSYQDATYLIVAEEHVKDAEKVLHNLSS